MRFSQNSKELRLFSRFFSLRDREIFREILVFFETAPEAINRTGVRISSFFAYVSRVVPVNRVSSESRLSSVENFDMTHMKIFEFISRDHVSTMHVPVPSFNCGVIPAIVFTMVWRQSIFFRYNNLYRNL